MSEGKENWDAEIEISSLSIGAPDDGNFDLELLGVCETFSKAIVEHFIEALEKRCEKDNDSQTKIDLALSELAASNVKSIRDSTLAQSSHSTIAGSISIIGSTPLTLHFSNENEEGQRFKLEVDRETLSEMYE